jgi:electron transfer flavoprotein beta subunit
MDIVVPIKFVPDLVDELEVDEDTGLLDRTFLRLVPSELDEHAIEEALLLKERHGGTITALCLDTGDVDETLYTAVAKGVDNVVKVTGEGFEEGISSHAVSSILADALKGHSFDLLLTGTQAVDDLDGYVAPFLAAHLGLPYVGYVTKVTAEGDKVVATKEYPGGLTADVEVKLPAVLGIQAAEQPPRYVVTSLVMDAMKSGSIDEKDAAVTLEELRPAGVSRMRIPEATSHAEMIDGNVEDVADALVALLKERGVLNA